MTRARLTDPGQVARYIAGGRGRMTLVSVKTGARFTYKFGRCQDDPNSPVFVRVLNGPDNTANYAYLGCLREDGQGFKYSHGRHAKIGVGATSARAIEWLVRHLRSGVVLDDVEVWHEGRCGRCGRALTVPESIASGIGPVCAGNQ